MPAQGSSGPESEQTIARLREELAAQQTASDRLTARLRSALHVSRIGTWTRDVRTGAVEWSPELAQLFGIPLEEAPRTIGAFFALIHPDDRAVFADAAAEALRTVRDYEVNFRYFTAPAPTAG
jgi:PAS domain-containing protein